MLTAAGWECCRRSSHRAPAAAHTVRAYTEAMKELMPTYMGIFNQMISARIQLIIAVDVRKAVHDNGWNDEVRSHVVEVVYKIKDHFIVISEDVHVIPE